MQPPTEREVHLLVLAWNDLQEVLLGGRSFRKSIFSFLLIYMCACMFMHSPFLEGWPRILLTVVLVNKTEIGAEFYNSLTLFLKCSINLLSLYRKKKKSTPVCLIRLKRFQPCPLFSPFLSLIPTVRDTTAHQGQQPGPKRPERAFKGNSCLAPLSHFCSFLPGISAPVQSPATQNGIWTFGKLSFRGLKR